MITIKTRETWNGVRYARHLIFHPFDGFWDMKYEKRGNIRAASVIILALVITFAAKSQYTGFIFNYTDTMEFNVFYKITSIVLPFFIWCISNWCITTLVDGEGSFKDIVMTTAYACTPLVLIQLPLVLLSQLITIQEYAFYQIFDTISFIWFGLLLFCGILTVHRFGVAKTILTILIAVVGMIVMMFLVVLFLSLIEQMTGFLRLLSNEIQLRAQK